MNGWQFMGEHPVLTFFLAYIGYLCVAAVAQSIALAIRRRR